MHHNKYTALQAKDFWEMLLSQLHISDGDHVNGEHLGKTNIGCTTCSQG